MSVAEQDLPDWTRARQVAEDEVSLPLFRRLAALLDQDPATLQSGDGIPLAWTALLFPTLAMQSQLGSDGHPRHGDFIPAMPLPKRMFAGRTVEQRRPVRIGDRLVRQSSITDLHEKQGRSGPLIFLTIQHEVTGDDGPRYVERQEVVFRDDGPTAAPRKGPQPMPEAEWQAGFATDPVLLFRYSALTYNGHRIHYDAPYATGIEGYQGLVVNGGLTTLMLLEFARRSLGSSPVQYVVRAMRPLIAGGSVGLQGARTEDGALFWATDAAGETAMTIRIGQCE